MTTPLFNVLLREGLQNSEWGLWWKESISIHTKLKHCSLFYNAIKMSSPLTFIELILQELQLIRGQLATEQSRCFKLEVSIIASDSHTVWD